MILVSHDDEHGHNGNSKAGAVSTLIFGLLFVAAAVIIMAIMVGGITGTLHGTGQNWASLACLGLLAIGVVLFFKGIGGLRKKSHH